MLSLTDIRKGKAIVLDGQPYIVTAAEYLRMQKTRPVVRATVRNVRTHQTKEHTFQQSDKIEEAALERVPVQFLYEQNGSYEFMNQHTFEQHSLGEDIVGDSAPLLLEGQEAELLMFEDEPISIELPVKIERRVTEAPPGVRGDTSTNTMKDVVIEGGTTVKAPLFIETNDIIRIDTRTGTYAERA